MPRTSGLVLLAAALVAGCATGSDNPDVQPRADVRDIAAPTDGPGDDALDAADGPVTDPDAGDGMGGDRDARADAADAGPPRDVNTTDACIPSTEVCNGRDDDCNGRVDESGCPGHVLITEVVAAPNEAEYVEIYNPTSAPIALGDVYLTDTNLYPRVIASTSPAVVDPSDFVARFPVGAMIAPGAYQTVATGNPGGWSTYLGTACPTYHLQGTATLGTCASSQAMRPVPGVAPSIGMTATLTNTGEPVLLFQWDGTADLMRDLDYVYFGAPGMLGPDVLNPPVDKSMLAVDGPDPDTTPTGYLLDTPPDRQQRAPAPALSAAAIRCDLTEGTETLFGGNGISGHNETSEDLATTWRVTTPTLPPDGGRIDRVNATPNAANVCP